MIKLSERRLRTVEGQAGIVAAIELEKKLGNQVRFEASPSFRELFEVRLEGFPYSDNLMRILSQQDFRLYSSRSALREYLEKNIHRVRSLPAVTDIIKFRSVDSGQMYNDLVNNVSTVVLLAAMESVSGQELLVFLKFSYDQ